MARSSTPQPRKPKSAQAFSRKLLAWWARAARDLPWRRTRDPYRVLVSEFMLQQTQVSRVAEYYPRFIEQFPDLGTLANAKPRAVREQWDGLGYYARAANVGPYTAGAVASFAYEKPVPAVDTNVRRVLLRVFFGDDRHRLTRQRLIPQRRIWKLARTLVPKNGKRAWKFNQAIMELGALVCVARKPKCPECPVRPNCKTGRRLVLRQTPRRPDA